MAFFTLSHVGASITVLGFFAAIAFIWQRPNHPWNGFVIGFLGLLTGPIVANVSDITEIVASVAGGNVRIERSVVANAAQVRSDTEEVRDLKRQIEGLAKQIKDANNAVAHSERNVSDALNAIRGTMRSLFETLYLDLHAVHHVVTTMPSQEVVDTMTQRVNDLVYFAFPEPKEQIAELTKLNAMIQAEGTPAPFPTPIPTPTH
jgi:hypothetical protein